MADIADGLLDGTFDSITGEYLGESDGYPRTHQYERSEPSTNQRVRGVVKWLEKNNIPKKDWRDLMSRFLIEEQPHLNMNNYNMDRNKMSHISAFCFNKFTNWITENLKQ